MKANTIKVLLAGQQKFLLPTLGLKNYFPLEIKDNIKKSRYIQYLQK